MQQSKIPNTKYEIRCNEAEKFYTKNAMKQYYGLSFFGLNVYKDNDKDKDILRTPPKSNPRDL